ncbi:hypothetical protein PACTADRAFT_42315 [Pachysolen tannophilus NRRL Y-2460]|uniref:Uncharacterized protein n=1 Tax=Pachysolen tannophilus NRRL Y-2460 TaxID=669874 RepID=A0A1E4TVA2_PACTA|nr:hypothetical protein PACTADRAFT_42315 [Pachysolen tannophilus NRRL Y-2460]
MDERQPLLPISSSHSNIVNNSNENNGNYKAKRFWAAIIVGIVCICIVNLIFLPRTSLGRDLRRIHGAKLPVSEVKRIFLNSLDTENHAREWLKQYTYEPHLAGDGYDLVEFTEQKFKEFGLKTEIETFYIWLNRPVDAHLKLLDKDSNVIYNPNLQEDKLPEDETSMLNNSVPIFHGYSANGNVTGKFTFANYGSKSDFEILEKSGVNVHGTICIMRYEKIFRGLKVKHAQQNGCIGAILYSDPYDDGEITVKNGYESYPNGPARNPSSVQRGSVEYFTDYPGDPTTIGHGSTKNCKRNSPKDYIPNIPSIPVSYRTIEPILAELNGIGPDLNWIGNLENFTYTPGPSKLELNLFNLQEYNITPIYNVMGKIDGILPEEQIIIGNHRDSWTFGAGDPNSGSATLLEVARAYGDLIKQGFKPLRTIVFASWDGEEYSMLGSTEFGETHSKFLQKKTLAYLNLDVSVTGTHFSAQANPLLEKSIHDVASKVPFEGATLFDYWHKQDNATIDFPGSGTDFAVFQNHLGIPIVNMGFDANGKTDPVYHYHSNYDSFKWMDTFADPDYKRHNCMAKFLGLLGLSLSEREVCFVSPEDYSTRIKEYYESFYKEIPTRWFNYYIDSAYLKYNRRNIIKQLQKLDEDTSPKFNSLLILFEINMNKLIETSKNYDSYIKDLQTQVEQDYPWFKFFNKLVLLIRIKLANLKLSHLDRMFLDNEALENRTWMKHTIFAPHRDLGYTGDVLPGLHEAIMRNDFNDAVKWLDILISKFQSVIKKLS